MKINENSLFAILLRSPWWLSLAIAVALAALLRLLMPTPYAVAAALPFAVVAAVVAWRRIRAPSGKRLRATLDRLRAMPWNDFAGAVASTYARQGYEVQRLDGAPTDFVLRRAGRTTLVSCKRWKATRTGIEPLRELDAERRPREADECIYFAAGEVTGQARAFAAERNIRLMDGDDLARLLA